MTVQPQLDSLQTSVDGGIQETQTYLANLQARIAEYDSQYQVSETASSYLQTAIDAANAAVDDLKKSATSLRTTTLSAAQKPVELVQQALAQVSQSLVVIKEHAATYDTKFQLAVHDARGNLETLTAVTRQRTTDAIQQASEQATNVQTRLASTAHGVGTSAIAYAGGVVQKVEAMDQYYHVSEKLQDTVALATGKAKELDATYQVTQRALDLDTQVTGGFGARTLNSATELVHSGLDYITGSLQYAKDVATSSNQPMTTTVPTLEPVSASVDDVRVKTTKTGAVEVHEEVVEDAQ
ncbi:hypothetical protein H310_12693 [Aphanomyces invadans]|uniref:Uncharacterized protein n=1 Tax=Aphanomyces invadans TaxID=157072 RepID=A0A024TGS6_9STRA|nr:hypothetical protein H310_12693 [Aphanomyces invadans]ETV93258.1 hypothetical protein H310_12693 [Aphanomyces invadans]RHY30080.1 hypothetical protein DYB32_004642 [Aphanomyces invadans]|eukprot:XP_008878093.1 hypothetical protein H310_12693 [Aphanomyces invadans]